MSAPAPTQDATATIPPGATEFDRLASVTIQGGAVYGLSLLGQLQGVLDNRYEIVALAGTSAGAIVSTLYWAGLKTTDIRKFFEDRSATSEGVTALLGRAAPLPGDCSIQQLNVVKGAVSGVARWAGGLFSEGWWSLGLNVLSLPVRLPRYVAPCFRAIRNIRAVLRSSQGGGLFPGELFEQEIDRLIRSSPRVAPHVESGRLPQHGFLTFGHLWGLLDEALAYFPALTLTTTDLSTRQLLLIDSTDPRFGDVPIARAVRASGGFPLFFTPVEIELPAPDGSAEKRVHSLVDGGVICNFPAYVFSQRIRREQLGKAEIYQPYVMRPWVNIGLRLTEPPTENGGPLRTRGAVVDRLQGFLTAGTRTHLETQLAESTVERLMSLGQRFTETDWPYELLDFEKLTPELVRAMYDRGRSFSSDGLASVQFNRPPAAEVEPFLDELIDLASHVFGNTDNSKLKFRSTLFVPDDLDLALMYRANMDSELDTDRALRLEYWQGLVGFSFIRRRPLLCNLKLLGKSIEEGVADPEQLFGMTPEIQSLVRKDRTWLISVPIFDPETAAAYPYGDNPEVGVNGLHYAELDSPLDGALFGVLSLDAGFDYGPETIPSEIEQQLNEAKVLALRDIMISVAWNLGKVFAAHFAASEPVPEGEEGGV